LLVRAADGILGTHMLVIAQIDRLIEYSSGSRAWRTLPRWHGA
jgi:hypothetical protein